MDSLRRYSTPHLRRGRHAKPFSNRHDHTIETRKAGDRSEVSGNFSRVRKHIVGKHQSCRSELRNQQPQLLRRADSVGIEEYQIEGPAQLADNRAGLTQPQIDAVEQCRAAEILASHRLFLRAAIDRDHAPARLSNCRCQPNRAVPV